MREIKLAFSNSITKSLPFLQLHSKYRITNKREVMSISNVNVFIKLIHLALKQEGTSNVRIQNTETGRVEEILY